MLRANDGAAGVVFTANTFQIARRRTRACAALVEASSLPGRFVCRKRRYLADVHARHNCGIGGNTRPRRSLCIDQGSNALFGKTEGIGWSAFHFIVIDALPIG